MITVAELDERIERCLAILAGNPHSQVFAALAEAYRRRGEFGRAFSVCKSGLKHHPKYAPAYVVLAKLYIHQKMLPDAQAALRTAVEIDGPTRATDFLEADMLLEMGDISGAEPIIERLRRSERRNPAVTELVKKLKQCRNQKPATKSVLRGSVGVDASPAPVPTPTPPTPAHESITWEEWAEAIRKSKGLQAVFAWDPASKVTYPVDAQTAGDSTITAIVDMFAKLDVLIHKADSAPLGGLRVETDKGDLWCSRHEDLIIGVIGDTQMSYGETRRLALEMYSRVERQTNTDAHESAELGDEQARRR